MEKSRLYEYKVLYQTPTGRTGTHFYMCECAQDALHDHAGVCMLHDRHLRITGVERKDPWTHAWVDETNDVKSIITELNESL